MGADAVDCFRRHNPTCLYAHPTSIERSFRNAIQVIDSRPLVALLAAEGSTNRGRELHELRPQADNFLKSLKKQGERGIVGERCLSFHYTLLPYHADSLVMVK